MHTCIQGQVSVDLNMRGAFWGQECWVEMAPWEADSSYQFLPIFTLSGPKLSQDVL